MIGIIDYGMGNLRSVEKAFHFLGFQAELYDSPGELQKADLLVLPGVGAFCDAMNVLRRKEFDKAIKEAVTEGKQLLGICLGMQLLFDISYENGVHEGLGLLPGSIVKLPGGVKIPHVGWNSLEIKKEAPLFAGFCGCPEAYVYFVHSYYLETDAPIVAATTFYGREVPAAVQKNNLFACQFHPEKSGDTGLGILKNFGSLKGV